MVKSRRDDMIISIKKIMNYALLIIHYKASACAMKASCMDLERSTNFVFHPQTRTWRLAYFSGLACALRNVLASKMLK